jgi:DNA-binding NtrC family response regulator
MQEDIDDFYVSYNNKADKNRSHARAEAEQFLANREDISEVDQQFTETLLAGAAGTARGALARYINQLSNALPAC